MRRREERMACLCLTWPVHRTVSDKEVWILYLQISKQNPNRIVSMTTLENTCTMLASGSWLLIHMGYSCGERSGGSSVGCWSWFHYAGCSMVELQPSLVIQCLAGSFRCSERSGDDDQSMHCLSLLVSFIIGHCPCIFSCYCWSAAGKLSLVFAGEPGLQWKTWDRLTS